MKRSWTAALAALALVVLAVALPGSSTSAAGTQGYLVVLAGTQGADGFAATGSAEAVRTAVAAAGGTIGNDLSKQIGVFYVHSASTTFAAALAGNALIESVGADFAAKALPSAAPEPVDDPGEALQWDMQQIRTDEAHEIQGGIRAVDVGVLDTGIDGYHVDFRRGVLDANVDCPRGRNSIAFLPDGPGLGVDDPCIDNGFHGTHVAGTIGARANGVGIVGVAPNVTLVPVKVCDSTGHCYASAVVDGITYAGDQKFDVINMSFFVDDNEFLQSTEFKCMNDPVQRTFRLAVERAIQYARSQGVTPVAALGNSDEDLAHPTDTENNCEVVPAETQGVIGTSSLGAQKEKARYSNYGSGQNDVAAPGGNGTTGDCRRTVLSTIPGNLYVCIQGTSMASPHAAGVAALIVSQFGTLGSDGDVKMSPTRVEQYLQSTAIDQGLPGYDECFGHGRIDALRAVTHDTSKAYDATAPYCPEYTE